MKLLYGKSSGFGLVEILVGVAVIAMLGVGGYIYYQSTQAKDSHSGLTKQEQADLKAACKVQIDDDLLCAVFTNWSAMSKDPVTYTVSSKTADGESSSMIVKSSGDDHHSVMTQDGQTMETIQVGNTYYNKINGVWYRYNTTTPTINPEQASDHPSSDLDSIINEDDAADLAYKNLGEEACGAITCVKYELVDKSEPDALNVFWIDAKTQRVMKTEMTEGDGSSTTTVYEYGAVTITAPEGAKDYSEMMGM